MSKTIWYVSKYFSAKTVNSLGGRDWFLTNKMAEKGHQVRVITSDSNMAFDIPELDAPVMVDDFGRLQVFWLKTLKYKVPKSIRRVLGWFHFEWNVFWLDKKRLPAPDVVIISSLSLLTIVNGFFLKRKYQCKLVFEVRDIWPLTIIEEGGFGRRNPFVMFLSLLEWLAYKYSDVVVGTMPNLTQHVEAVLGYKRLVHCVPMGFDESMMGGDEVDKDFIENNFDSRFFNVVHAGAIGITNALEFFFEAAKKLKSNSRVRFILVGDGALKQFYEEKYGYLDNVFFAGKVPKRQVQSVLKNADVVYFSVFKSRVWDYGQSLNKVVDYMLSGKPVLASFSGYPSMINEAESGFFVPSEDSEALAQEIERLSESPRPALYQVGARGAKWIVENRSYSKLADQYLSYIV
ncbi:glycosyltransferase family 4 protein [Pseudomonas seleniipraecipitans]|uniref:Glycosyltransferase family 4 protein n=1 Tax=Phytopseudomonas seleniipraecipitans TaxID=640205 RepID=A0ABY5J7M3_9GAMM|nr:glycosyltransferase family 4 protein [Pseudomonas seleniipraecipitans]UUD64069.1 glycosyltransferase family 4 protein [Pseudomonas seleniipraecipitans]